MATDDRLKSMKEAADADDAKQMAEAATNGQNEESGENSTSTESADAAPINENLFLDEDLEGLDDELNDLDMD